MTTGNAEHITVDAALRPSRTTMTATANTAKHASVTRVRAALPTRSLLDDDDEEEEEVQETERHAVHSKAAPNVTNNGDTTMQHSPTGTTTSSTASLVDWNRNATNNNNNKRRHTLALGSNANANANGTKNKKRPLPYAWDDFVRTGTRLKSLFGHAMHHVQTTVAVVATTTTPGKRMRTNNNNNNNDDDEDEGDQHQQKQHQDTDYTAELAREKMEQVMLLQRQLKEAQAHTSALNASNDSLREEAASSQNRLERTVAALRIAGSNAAKARGDADTAQATATGLAQSLQSLQTVVTETKRASQVLHQDQQQVSTAATSIQAKLLQKEADLARAQKEMLSMRTSQKRLESSHQRWKEERSDLQFTLDDQKQGLLRLGHGMAERDAVERARKERADQIELEWREAQAMLVQATAGQAAAEQTQALLKQSILELHAANKQLHEQAWGQQEASRKEKERLHEALTKAEKQAQQLRIRGEATEEDMQRLRLDKTAAEKQVSQLKTRLAGLERRLKDAGSTTMVSPDAMNESTHVSPPNNNESSTGIALGTGLGFSLPPLSGSSRLALVGGGQDNSNDNAPVPAKCCSICFKAAFGLMQSCQCGKPDCDKRAHLSCMNKIKPGPSVSHPGTPAPRLPLVLCAATATASRSSSSTDTAATGIASN